jgi:spore maturation protein CgeB
VISFVRPLRIVIVGLTITSSWGNGHATTYRALVRGLAEAGHDVLFLERDKPWYAGHRDLPAPPWGQTRLYGDVAELESTWGADIAAADLVVVGSYVPDGIPACRLVQRIARGVTAFYDIDTPVTLAALEQGRCDYLDEAVIPDFGVYLSFTGGPVLRHIEQRFGARMARALYCSAYPRQCRPDPEAAIEWNLGYIGTYSDDRQPAVESLLCAPARAMPQGRFVVAGPQYPDSVAWPGNVERIEHCPPNEHRAFYAAQRFTLNITRADMVRAGFSPSVRLFEAAACGTPIISDWWPGLDEFFTPNQEIIIAHGAADVLRALALPEPARVAIAAGARARVLAKHTGAHRAAELTDIVQELRL